MARLNYIEYFKRALLEFATESDPLYAMLQWMTEKIMQLEAEQKVGAQKGEHSTDRATHFSGNRLRRFDTRMGTMYLLVPKLRKGGYIPLGRRFSRAGFRASGRCGATVSATGGSSSYMEELGLILRLWRLCQRFSDTSHLTGFRVIEERQNIILFDIRSYFCPRDDSNIRPTV